MATKVKKDIKDDTSEVTVELTEEARDEVNGGVAEALITFDEYLSVEHVGVGLIASFRYEASQTHDGLTPRSKNEWAHALEAQANRVYK